MAQGVISHLTYERLGVLVSDFPAYKTTPYASGDLMRVQSLNFSFSHPAIDMKAVGSDVLGMEILQLFGSQMLLAR